MKKRKHIESNYSDGVSFYTQVLSLMQEMFQGVDHSEDVH